MKKKRIFVLSGLLLATAAGTTAAVIGSSIRSETAQAIEIDSYYLDTPFACENWYNSGKGFMFEFTFTQANYPTDKIQFCPISRNPGDVRITKNYPIWIQVDANGVVTSTLGNVIKNESGTYTFTMMFSELDPSYWNTDDGINGTELINQLYFRYGGIKINSIKSSLIDSAMNVAPKADVRNETIDDNKGLMFYSYVPKVKTGAKYGMAIVPNEYIGKLTNGYCESFTANGKSFVESYCNPHQIDSSNPYLYNRYGSGYYIKCSLNVKEQNYLRDFSAVPFEEIDGVRTYAWNIGEEKDNLYSACSRLRGVNNAASEYVSNVLSSIENKSAIYSTTAVNAYIVDNTKQVLKNESLSNGDSVLSFGAAKGETETGQLVLKSTSSSNLTYFAGISDLISGLNVISNKNIEIDMQHYVNIEHNWESTLEHYNYLSDLYPNSYEECTLGWWPDALIPMPVAVRDGRNIINTTNGNNQGLFFRINVPDEAASGIYTGNVFVYIPGQGTITVPVSLNVYNFSLVNRKEARTIANLSKTEIEKLYGIGYNNVCDTPYYSNAYNFLAERGVSGGLVSKSWFNSYFDEYIETVKNVVKQRKTDTYFLEFNSNHVEMDWTHRKASGTRTFHVSEDIFTFEDEGERKGLKTILRRLFDESTNDFDLLRNATIYDPHADEPSTPSAYIRNVLNFNVLRCAIDAVLSDVSSVTGKDGVKQSLNNVFYLMTAGPEQSISGRQNDYAFTDVTAISNVSGGGNCCCSTLADIRYKQITNFTPNMMWDWQSGIDWTKKSHKDAGDLPESSCGYCYDGLAGIYAGTDTTNKMWEYTCVQPTAPYPSFTLNTPMIRMRANRWREFNLNIEGFMYYMANRTEFHPGDDQPEYVMTEDQILEGQIYYSGASSDGLLMYPAYNTFNYADRNLYWLSSLRLENLGESNDDVNYLYLAKELIAQQANASSYETRLRNICNTLSVDNCPAKVTNNSTTLKTARANLVSLIEDLM